MAKRSQDLAAAKAKKQKIILIVGGVLLLGVAGFQGPKLLKGSGSSSAPEASASSSATGATLTPGAVQATTAPKGSAMVAGVVLPKATVVKVAPSQLASFTLFEVKDPFVQHVGATVPGQAASDATASQNAQASASDASGQASASTGATSDTSTPTQAASPPPPAIAYATINFNGEPQQVQAKDKFPADAPLFVVRSIKSKQVKIGVAGGSFDDSQAVTLTKGKTVTLVNTATGVRYELKLVYTGATPEVIQSFTTTAPAASGSTADALAGTSQTATPAK